MYVCVYSWCYNEKQCLERAGTPLGSSKTWSNIASNMVCDPNNSFNFVQLYYCDGASFSGYRKDPWPAGNNATLMFRGIKNLDAALNILLEEFGLNEAEELILAGGSAGGLATYLHLDHVASVMSNRTNNVCKTSGKVDCVFFLDVGNEGFAPEGYTYPEQMKYVFEMQNAQFSL